MHTPPANARQFEPYVARLSRRQKMQDRCRKASLRDVRDQCYGAKALHQRRHGHNVLALHDRIQAELDELASCRVADIANHISKHIALLLSDAALDLSLYPARGEAADEYGKFLLFSSLSLDIPGLRDSPFCIQLFSFNPGQATPIHNHPCECASLVLSGEISEYAYHNAGAAQVHEASNRLRGERDRSELEVEYDNLPHRLRNGTDDRCITAHVYAMDGISAGQTSAVKQVFVQVAAQNG